jgi:LysR family transcriptional regulator, regulator for metE and metH
MPAVDLEIRHLRLVASIADAGTMTAAADRLCLTQSALSHQLRDIEGRIGAAFFVRLGRRMVLTAAGRRILDTARRVLADVDRAEADLRRLAGHTDGSIRVCTECNTGYHWLAPLLTSFRRKHPRVAIHVAADATAQPLPALLDGRVDLAILIDPAVDRRLRLRPLFLDEMVAIVAKGDPLAKRRWVDAADLATQHLLLYSSSPDESFAIRRVLRPAGLTAERVSFIMLTEAMIELARAGTGVGILPRWSAQRAIAGGGVVALSLTRRGMRRQWVAATLAAQADPPYVVDFLDLLADHEPLSSLAGKRFAGAQVRRALA